MADAMQLSAIGNEMEGVIGSGLPRGDTPVDLIRFRERGHLPPSSKKVRTQVGMSNRQKAEPTTLGRHTKTPVGAPSRSVPTPTAFNRSGIMSEAELSGRPSSTTPTSFLHTTRGAASMLLFDSSAIPQLREEDRVVDSLDKMLKESIVAGRSTTSRNQLGGFSIPPPDGATARTPVHPPLPDAREVHASILREMHRKDGAGGARSTPVLGPAGYVEAAVQDPRSRLLAAAGTPVHHPTCTVMHAKLPRSQAGTPQPSCDRQRASPDPRLFSYSPAPGSTQGLSMPPVFSDVRTAGPQPKLRFERTDYHNTQLLTQAPPAAAAHAAGHARFAACDRGLGSSLSAQADKFAREAARQSHVERARGKEAQVKAAVESELALHAARIDARIEVRKQNYQKYL